MNIKRHNFKRFHVLYENKRNVKPPSTFLCSLFTLHSIHCPLPHRSAFPNHVSPSSSHHTYSAFPIPLSTPERDRPFKDRCSVLLSIGCRSTNYMQHFSPKFRSTGRGHLVATWRLRNRNTNFIEQKLIFAHLVKKFPSFNGFPLWLPF